MLQGMSKCRTIASDESSERIEHSGDIGIKEVIGNRGDIGSGSLNPSQQLGGDKREVDLVRQRRGGAEESDTAQCDAFERNSRHVGLR